MIERESIDKKSGAQRHERIYGITRASAEQASDEQVLRDNRGLRCVESCHYINYWNDDEDRSRIRTGHGPENITRLRRFAIRLLKGKKIRLINSRENEKTSSQYPGRFRYLENDA